MKILFSTILMVGVLSVFTLDSAAKDKKPKAIPVTCGSPITAPGNYFLSGNCTGAGITITASKVTLDLKRHTLTGNGISIGINVDDVSRVNIIGPGTLTNFGVGVDFSNVRNSVLENVSVTGNNRGINVTDSSGNDFRKNKVNDNVNFGIRVFASTDNEIEENEFNGNDLGIHLLNNSTDNEIVENEANGNDVGIELDSSNDNEVEDNEANENRLVGIALEDSHGNKVKENEANGNGGGISLSSSNDNEIEENEANENTQVGIFLTFSSGNKIKENEANGNSRGIRLSSGSVDNEIEENAALNNTTFDLDDQNLNCDNNEWEDNTFNTANQPCID